MIGTLVRFRAGLAERLGPLLLACLLGAALSACAPVREETAVSAAEAQLNALAEDYVHLSLEAGTYEPGYIDAYYGPPEWQAEAERNARSVEGLTVAADSLIHALDMLEIGEGEPLLEQRRRALKGQLVAAHMRLKMMTGEKIPFRQEALGLFGAAPMLKPLAAYEPVLERIDAMLPGEAPLDERVEAFQDRYVIAPDRLKAVFDAAIAECRKRTMRHIDLPAGESFAMAFVTGKSWSGYNYYQGNLASRIEINTDLPIRASRAVDLGCHEGYPGHHAYNMLLEARLMRERGWIEYSVYPLYSPQSLIAEGSANYGIELAFPGEERLAFERAVIFPLAGLDPASADTYFDLLNALSDLKGARFTIAQMYLDGEIDRETAIAHSRKYQLLSEARARQTIDFTDQYRSYVINYGLGLDMVREHVEGQGSAPLYRWAAMTRLLSEPAVPADLVRD